jgi:hypothetical protein
MDNIKSSPPERENPEHQLVTSSNDNGARLNQMPIAKRRPQRSQIESFTDPWRFVLWPRAVNVRLVQFQIRALSRRKSIHASSLVVDFPAGLYLAGNPFLYLCFDPANSPGSQRHWPWEPSFGDAQIDSAP